jgi:carotenoid 1,2-hydratase
LPLPRRLAAGRIDGFHALGEVADFRRFHSPLIRWMARFRMRVEPAA